MNAPMRISGNLDNIHGYKSFRSSKSDEEDAEMLGLEVKKKKRRRKTRRNRNRKDLNVTAGKPIYEGITRIPKLPEYGSAALRLLYKLRSMAEIEKNTVITFELMGEIPKVEYIGRPVKVNSDGMRSIIQMQIISPVEKVRTIPYKKLIET
jgi:hypothetical protein